MRILNAIFSAVQRIGCNPSLRTAEYVQDREPSVRVGDTHVSFSLEPIKDKLRSKPFDKQHDRLRLTFGSKQSNYPTHRAWEDTKDGHLEDFLTEIVVQIIVTGERCYRQGRARQREWFIHRKAEIEEEIRREKAEAERKAQELRAKQEKERIDRLLAEAQAMNQSKTIRE